MIRRTRRQQLSPDRNRPAWFASRRICNAASFACLHHRHQLVQGVEAAWEADVGVELYKHFPGFADAQARVESSVEGCVEARHVASRHKRGNQGNRLLSGRQ
ncbi:hypothetical protein KPSA1_01332 [Pseudomonas syringae pv. actinidiae]|uniref:Uncharacterized protein n=1 Tax=Pseudomonas syringae pv. actinidiae TaxID=103796 RepID=A0A2V0QBU4_PSESF|nr:hypothetical protein KPSA1_01332 [Pseudomonas syringae pv. actinidiae]